MRGVAVSASTDFEAWFPMGRARLMRVAYLLTSDQSRAEDLAQATLVKVYLSWDRISSSDNVNAYARKVLLNEFNSDWRRPVTRREVLTDQPLASLTLVADGPNDPSDLFALVKQLPPQQRAVLVLRYYEGLTEAEIAAVLGISSGTVKAHANRALGALRAQLPQTQEEA